MEKVPPIVKRMSHSGLSDPKYTGPGTWFALHTLASNSANAQAFFKDMQIIINNFKCGDCRNHAQQYIKDHPFNIYLNMKDENGTLIGPAKYMWEFHNTVNSRFNPPKPLMDWKTCWATYSQPDTELCLAGCGGDGHSADEPKSNKLEIARNSTQRLEMLSSKQYIGTRSRLDIIPEPKPKSPRRSPQRNSGFRLTAKKK